MDVLTKQQRKQCMSAVRNKDTKPEIVVRKLVHSLGYRYRLHGSNLPGKPDLVLTSKRKVIFVHGCFWHRHSCKKGRSMPLTQKEFWREKLDNNKVRDRRDRRKLKELGWQTMIVWECETRNIEKLTKKLKRFLIPSAGH